MRPTGIIALLLLSMLLPGLMGCSGYGVVRYGDSLGEYQTISVVTPTNDSTEPGLEMIVGEALRREFLHRGALRVVPNPDDADLVVRGSIRPLVIVSQSVSSVSGVLEHAVTLSLNLRVEAREGESFRLPRLSASAIYPASADIEAGRKNRDEALRHVAEVLAGRTHDSMELRLTQ